MSELASSIVIEAINDLNQTSDGELNLGTTDDTLLLDSNSAIDSLALVRLLMTIEQEIEEQTGQSIVIVDESVFDSTDNPFRTVGSITAHVAKLLS